jgi:molybdopterin-guanine dinucleotide biosynthesis protein A
MGKDKGSIIYHQIDQRTHCAELLKPFCDEVFISIRKEQESLVRSDQKIIFDLPEVSGPASGILALHQKYPHAALLVLACDMPNVTRGCITALVERRSPQRAATCYFLSEIEPLFAIWEPETLACLKNSDLHSPRWLLKSLDCELVQGDPAVLRNINEPTALLIF